MSTGGRAVEHVVTEVATTIATDYVNDRIFNRLHLQGGGDFTRYTVVSRPPNPNTEYTGFDIMATDPLRHQEDAIRLHVPTDRTLWLARSVHMLLTPESRRNIESGYFWQDDAGDWATDVRHIADPQILGQMAQEQQRRASLVQAIREVGATAVGEHVRYVGSIEVTATSAAGDVLHTTLTGYDMYDVIGLQREMSGERALGLTLPQVLHALTLES